MTEAYASSIERLRAVAGTARDPDGHAFAVIAEYLRRDGKLEEAREVVERGREESPDFASGHLVAAQIFTELGDLEPARDALTRLHELDSANTRASSLRQRLAAAEEKAAVAWARAQGVGPAVHVDDEVATVTLGELYLEQGSPDKALVVARQLLAEDAEHAGALALLAKAEGLLNPVEDSEPEEVASAADATVVVTPDAPPLDDSALIDDVALPDDVSLPDGPTLLDDEALIDVVELAPSPIPIETLGPDAVPIASLAPDVVDVSSLAPASVPVADLAPDEGGKQMPDADDENLGDFMSWLDEN